MATTTEVPTTLALRDAAAAPALPRDDHGDHFPLLKRIRKLREAARHPGPDPFFERRGAGRAMRPRGALGRR